MARGRGARTKALMLRDAQLTVVSGGARRPPNERTSQHIDSPQVSKRIARPLLRSPSLLRDSDLASLVATLKRSGAWCVQPSDGSQSRVDEMSLA